MATNHVHGVNGRTSNHCTQPLSQQRVQSRVARICAMQDSGGAASGCYDPRPHLSAKPPGSSNGETDQTRGGCNRNMDGGWEPDTGADAGDEGERGDRDW